MRCRVFTLLTLLLALHASNASANFDLDSREAAQRAMFTLNEDFDPILQTVLSGTTSVPSGVKDGTLALVSFLGGLVQLEALADLRLTRGAEGSLEAQQAQYLLAAALKVRESKAVPVPVALGSAVARSQARFTSPFMSGGTLSTRHWEIPLLAGGRAELYFNSFVPSESGIEVLRSEFLFEGPGSLGSFAVTYERRKAEIVSSEQRSLSYEVHVDSRIVVPELEKLVGHVSRAFEMDAACRGIGAERMKETGTRGYVRTVAHQMYGLLDTARAAFSQREASPRRPGRGKRSRHSQVP